VAVLVPQHSPATVEPTSDPLRDLERFGRLRRDGHLSDEECEAVKRRLLDQT
jgi:hypothetical protein